MLPWVLLCVASVLLIGIAMWAVAYRATHRLTDEEHRNEVANARKHAVRQSRSVKGGHDAEVFAPWIPGFEYEPADTFHLGATVDLIVFDGLEAGEVRDVVFVEVKTGSAVLNGRQRLVRDAIEDKRVRFETVRIVRGGDGDAPTATTTTTAARRKPLNVTDAVSLSVRPAEGVDDELGPAL